MNKNIFLIDKDTKENLGNIDFIPKREDRMIITRSWKRLEYKVKCIVHCPDENGVIEDVEFLEIRENMRKHKKIDLREQKRYGIMLLFISYGIMKLSKIIPELLFWVFILGTLGITAILSKDKIIF